MAENKMLELLMKNKFLVVFAILGAIGGFLYWKYIGCLSGTCPIKSVWYLSTLFGALIGYLAGSIINDLIIKYRKKGDSEK